MKTMLSQTFIIFGIIVAVVLLHLLAPILTPFLVGALLAYLFNPLVVKLKRKGVPNLLSVLLVFIAILLILTGLILLLIPLVQKQIILFVQTTPAMIAWVQTNVLPWVSDNFIDINSLKESLGTASSKMGDVVSWTLATVLHSGQAVIFWMGMIFLIPVVTFYLLRDWQRILKAIRNLLPRSIEPTVVKLTEQCDEVLSAFFRGQLLVMFTLGVLYCIGLSIIGLKLGILIGIMIGFMSIVPYLGVSVGILMATIAALVQFGAGHELLLIWLVFLIVQSLEGSMLTPLLVGKRIGLHPVAVIFSVLAGGRLFGFFGILLALPVAAIVMVWLRYLHQRYHASRYYQ